MLRQTATNNCIANCQPSSSVFVRLQVWAIQKADKILTQLRDVERRRKDRAAFRQMLNLDDHILRDIGVTREDVIWANNLPLSQNASCQLRKKSQARRRKL